MTSSSFDRLQPTCVDGWRRLGVWSAPIAKKIKVARVKKDYHSILGSSSELMRNIDRDANLSWMKGLAQGVRDAMAALKAQVDDFGADALLLERSALLKKWGEEEASVSCKKFLEVLEPAMKELEEAKNRLERHMRVG